MIVVRSAAWETALEAEWHNMTQLPFVMQAEEIRYGNGHGHTSCNVISIFSPPSQRVMQREQHAVLGKINENLKWKIKDNLDKS